ncbi:MAG: chemotaxis protein CheA [Candidatus Omnitrophica bacterium]|nr:chemotaxis protein CheA [Candidatus Omnitrophota bacterium]
MTFDTQNYIELFYQDADEHLQIMTDALLDLERNPGDKEALASVFRSAHTMKSSSAMVGFMHVSEFTHRMEDMIGYLRDNDVPITSDMVTVFFKGFDVLKEMLSQLQDEAAEAKRNQTNHSAKDLIKVFESIANGDAPAPEDGPVGDRPRIRLNEENRNRVEELRLSGESIFEISIRFCDDVQMAATRAFLVINNLARIGTVILTAPDLDDESQSVVLDFSILFSSKEKEPAIRKQAEVSEIERVEIREVTDIEQFEWPHSKPEASSAAPSKENFEAPGDSPALEAITSFDRREDHSRNNTVRVSIEKLDRLLNLAAEMVIHRGRIHEIAQQLVLHNGKGGLEEEILDSITQQGLFLTQLQETIMESRMVPIGMVFSRFRRVVRDLAHAHNKKVNLVLEGEETELDKKIIDQIGDPLMHMVRNAVDHGLETPGERRAAGKSEEGLLHLNAFHQGNNILISIRDDGRGLNLEAIKKKALENGIVNSEEMASMAPKECLQLIFRPGFSTAEQITDISGRGVGMDVVRRSIEALGGSVELETEAGRGAAFWIKLPLTLAIIQALLVEAGGEIYALPISNVSETIRIRRSDVFSVNGTGKVIRLRDDVVPILNLDSLVAASSNGAGDELCYVAVIRHGGQYAGLIVDRMVNEQEIVIKSLSGDIACASYIAGAAILGNGRVILILDAASLVEQTLGAVV